MGPRYSLCNPYVGFPKLGVLLRGPHSKDSDLLGSCFGARLFMAP